MRVEALETSMRREQTKAEAVARLMASFASHLQAATTETVRETAKAAESHRLPQRQDTGAAPSSFFADLHPAQENVSALPKAADPVRPADTEQHAAASRSATANVSRPDGALDRVADRRPTASSVAPPAQTSSAKGDSNAAHPTSRAANPANGSAQSNGPSANAPTTASANAPTAPAATSHTDNAMTEADAVNAEAQAETAPVKVAGDAKATDVAPVTAEHAAVAAKGMKSATQHASKDDEATEAPTATAATPAQASADTAARTMMPETAVSANRTAAATSPTPAEAPQVAPLSGATPAAAAMGIAPRPRSGANQPAEAKVAGEATPTPASARTGAADASHLDGADATIRPQADGGLLVTLAPSANGPVQIKLEIASGAVSNLVFIAPYQQTRSNLEALRPAIAGATRGGASMRIQSNSRDTSNSSSQGLTEMSGEGDDHPHIDVKI